MREALLRPPENRIKPTCRRYPSVEPCQLRKRAPYRRRRIGTAAGGDPCLPLAWPPWLGNLLGAIPALEYGGASACLTAWPSRRCRAPAWPGGASHLAACYTAPRWINARAHLEKQAREARIASGDPADDYDE